MDLTAPKTRRRRGDSEPRAAGYAGDFLGIEALSQDGLLIRSDGAFVRYLEVIPNNPLVMDEEGCQRMTRGFTQLLQRVGADMSVQAYVQATPVALDELLARSRAQTDAATAALVDDADPALQARGQALRRLAAAHEESLCVHAEDMAAVEVRYVLVVPFLPDLPSKERGVRRAQRDVPKEPALRRSLATHLRHATDSQRLAESLRSALAGLDMKSRTMTGPEIADLLWTRCAPHAARATPAQAPSRTALRTLGALNRAVDRDSAVAAARTLRESICQGTVDLSDPRRVSVDGDLEHTMFVARRPERTFYGWLLHAMQTQRPWTLSVHVTVRDRAEVKLRYERKERRIAGINDGAANSTRRPDREQERQEQELAALTDELATGAETICDVAIYQTVRELGPEPDGRALGAEIVSAMRALSGAVDARVDRGEIRQPKLWLSSLPLGLDVAQKSFRVLSRHAADCMPFVSTSCGSPGGIPFAFADPGRTVEGLNPFDGLHDNGVMLVFAKSGGGKTATVLNLTSAAMTRGAQVNVIDRSKGHYEFLCSLIPGAVHLELGDETGPVINPWDVEDLEQVPRAKVAFLVRLHALLVGDHDAGSDSYGLGPLERNLLALAIREVYARAAAGHGVPCESFLREVLTDLGRLENADPDGSAENASVFRNLAHRLGEFCADGTYGYLLDRPTSVGAEDAPLVVFNTSQVPDDISAAVLFVALEFITNRVERRYERHLSRLAHGYRPAGPFEGTSAVVIEEIWKVVRRRATREWVVEQAKRARHIGQWLIAISQSREDLAGEEARALLVNSSMQLLLRQGSDDLEGITDALRLGGEEVAQIEQLVTEKRAFAQAYLINGERGRGTLSIRLGSHVYWLCTSDPHGDLPVRERALQQADFYHPSHTEIERAEAAWAALDLVADPAWHRQFEAGA